MTAFLCYAFAMFLLSVFGGVVSALLFLICFILVLLCRYARIGYLSTRKQKDKPQEKKPEPKAEPVYYLVERKRKAPKKQYGEPKEIKFK